MNAMEEKDADLKELSFELLSSLGVECTDTNIEQMAVYLESFTLFAQRNAVYSDLWKDYGWMDTLTHVRSKTMRLVRKFWHEEGTHDDDLTLLDDAFDLINYAVFFIRNFKEKNKWGSWGS